MSSRINPGMHTLRMAHEMWMDTSTTNVIPICSIFKVLQYQYDVIFIICKYPALDAVGTLPRA